MADIKKFANDALLLNGARQYRRQPTNGEKHHKGLKNQYLADVTRANVYEVGELASNVYDTKSQGIDVNDFYKYVPIRIRVVKAAQSTTGETMLDDWQKIQIIAPSNIDTILQGAYMEFEDNVWIVYKPKNVAPIIGNAVIRRCNTVINKLDYYGNIVSIPMSFARSSTQGNAPVITENNILAQNYISCICQLNEYTKDFTENTRLILGKAAYSIRGINDFTREYTYDQDSVHFMTFTVQRQEPLEQDSIELQCADYYSLKWELILTANVSMNVGNTQNISVTAKRNGDTVQSTAEHPLTYIYHSSDETIATVNYSGEITAIADGAVEITVSLAENPNIKQTLALTVTSTSESYVAFTSTTVDVLHEYDSVDISAAYYENGEATSEAVTFEFSGAPKSAYSAEQIGFNTYRITAYATSNIPLEITIRSGGKSEKTAIKLVP